MKNRLNNTETNPEDKLILADEAEPELTTPPTTAWKVMIVDDDPEVHKVTHLALGKSEFIGRPLTFISAYSGQEAIALLPAHPDTALIFLDVVMEAADSGLQVVRYVRETLQDKLVRIVLRTGYPGQAPPRSVIVDYDINDYRLKTEMKQGRMFVTTMASLRNYLDLATIEASRLNQARLNKQLRHEMAERKKLEQIHLEKERLRLEKEFLEKEKQVLARLNANKDKFFSIVAHDLRNPFSLLITMAHILTEAPDELAPKDIRRIGRDLESSVQNVYHLLGNLLQWAALQMGRVEHNPTDLDLGQIAAQTITLLQESASQKGVTLQNKIPLQTPAYGDANMLDTVIRNLTSNAMKFTPSGGKITLTALIKEKENPTPLVEVSITDTGIGISENILAKLFQVGEQVTRRGTAKERGTGLGLIIAQEMVEKNGGQIWVESVVEQGTTVKFTVPQHT